MPLDEPEDDLLVRGFAVGGYRSFSEVQYLGPFRKITVLAGRNNSGKSNVLRFLRDHYNETVAQLTGLNQKSFGWADGEDRPLRGESEDAAFGICRELSGDGVVEWATALPTRQQPVETLGDRVEGFLRDLGSATPGPVGSVWRIWSRQQRNTTPADQLQAHLSEAANELAQYRAFLTNNPGHTLKAALEPPVPPQLEHSPVFIPAVRQIRDSDDLRWDGGGLIRRLADLQHPDLGADREAKVHQWESLTKFVKSVLEDENVELEIPSQQNRLIVSMNGREQDVEDLGTGVHEVIMLAAAATAHHETLLLLEEPEIHLHPLLQKRLLNYLDCGTSNQYVIATHSAHFLDHDGAAVFHVALDRGWSTVEPVVTNSAAVRAARDLGYSPSDLLQANCVVWVEGPSDRIYLRFWLEATEPDLVEGVDYSIMFYGGVLMAHTTGADRTFREAEGELVELRRINRRSAILIDSDREASKKHLKASAKRLRDEFEDGGFAWVTKGREVENYLPPDVVLEALREIDKAAEALESTDDYGRRWRYRRKGEQEVRAAAKVDLARQVVALKPTVDVLDLKQRLRDLAAFIRSE